MDDLKAKFLPRFLRLASERLRGAVESVAGRRRDLAANSAHDLHSLAGEAGLLGLEAVVVSARGAEAAARRFAESGAEGDAESLAECLEELRRVVEVATSSIPPPA